MDKLSKLESLTLSSINSTDIQTVLKIKVLLEKRQSLVEKENKLKDKLNVIDDKIAVLEDKLNLEDKESSPFIAEDIPF